LATPEERPGPRPKDPPPPKASDETEARRRLMRDYSRYSGLGIEFSVTVLLFGWIGWKLDTWTGLGESFPLLLLSGLFLGLGLGIYRMKLRLDPPGDDGSKSRPPRTGGHRE